MEDINNQKRRNSINKVSKIHEFLIYPLFALGPITGNLILVLFGVLSSDFNVNPTEILAAIPSFMFPFAFIQLFSGAISDVRGRFPIIILGLIIFTLGLLIAAISFSLLMFIIANILSGIGFGFVNPVLIALMTDITEGPKIPKKMGFLGAVAILGVGLGPLIAGQFVIIGWRYLYVLFVTIIIICLIFLFALKKPPRKDHGTFGLHVLLSHISQEIRRPVVILLILSAFLITQTYIATIIWTSTAFIGFVNEAFSGIILALAALVGTLTSILIGFIIERKGVGIGILFGIILVFLGIIILIFLGDVSKTENLGFITLGLIFVNMSGGMLLPSIMFYSQFLSKERRGALAGLATAGQFIGIALVPMTYEPFFHYGGITLVYLVILVISITLSIILGILYKLAK